MRILDKCLAMKELVRPSTSSEALVVYVLTFVIIALLMLVIPNPEVPVPGRAPPQHGLPSEGDFGGRRRKDGSGATQSSPQSIPQSIQRRKDCSTVWRWWIGMPGLQRRRGHLHPQRESGRVWRNNEWGTTRIRNGESRRWDDRDRRDDADVESAGHGGDGYDYEIEEEPDGEPMQEHEESEGYESTDCGSVQICNEDFETFEGLDHAAYGENIAGSCCSTRAGARSATWWVCRSRFNLEVQKFESGPSTSW